MATAFNRRFWGADQNFCACRSRFLFFLQKLRCTFRIRGFCFFSKRSLLPDRISDRKFPFGVFWFFAKRLLFPDRSLWFFAKSFSTSESGICAFSGSIGVFAFFKVLAAFGSETSVRGLLVFAMTPACKANRFSPPCACLILLLLLKL